MKRYTIDFGGGEIEIYADSESEAMLMFRKWLLIAPGKVWIPGYNCIKEEEID